MLYDGAFVEKYKLSIQTGSKYMVLTCVRDAGWHVIFICSPVWLYARAFT